jgi:hypothetical protein
MKIMIEFPVGKSKFQLLSFFAYSFALILFLTSCNQKPEAYSIIEFTGGESVLNYSKSLYYVSFKSDSVSPAALLAGNNDLIFYGDGLFIYRKTLGNKFQFSNTKQGGYINGKLATLNLHKRNDMISWFKKMETTDLSWLEFMKVDSLIPEDYYPYLASLAKLKPGIGLYYDGDLNEISRLISLFNPKYLVGERVYSSDFKLLSQLTNLELLVVTLNDSVNNGPLPAMPALKYLFLTEVNKNVVLDDKFLSENKSLERLAIMETARIDFSLLKPLNNLKELVISNFDTVVNPELIKNHKNLEVLSIINEKSICQPVIDGPDQIRWMSFSPDVPQNIFNSFINNHPGLEVAEILKNDTISSFSSLLKLRNLYGLIVSDTLTDLSSVKSLKSLKYLSLPAYVLKDKSVKDELHKLIPEARIVANEGFCLGSGWLLIIVPLVILFSLVAKKKFQRVTRSV